MKRFHTTVVFNPAAHDTDVLTSTNCYWSITQEVILFLYVNFSSHISPVNQGMQVVKELRIKYEDSTN